MKFLCSATECSGLTMTIGTENSKIFNSVVGANTIDVIQLQGKWTASPIVDSTIAALVFQNVFFDQSLFQPMGVGNMRALNENLG